MRFPRSSGILLHPTSLPGTYGSGDFGAAAFHFVDWLAAAGQKMWQILPLGGIGPGNSPYMSSSAFAGNVLLIDLDDLHAHGWLNADDLAAHAEFVAQRVDYSVVYPYRMEKLRIAAGRFFADTQHHAEYEAFCISVQTWLDDYALFMALAEKFAWQDWAHWDAGLARREKKALAKAAVELEHEIEFWSFCQWCFFRQWRKLKQYANERGVQVIGDIPIFIAYQSAEVWARQELFELGEDHLPVVIAGVPPDYFSATGQRWGNPLYRWHAHEKEGYAWWIERIRKTTELVDIVRIDHFRGFAGYWEIPASEQTAVNGRWMQGPGENLFNAIQATLGTLPIIAEDLGIITPDVVALLEKFNLPGMRILQFAFGGGADNPYLPHNFKNNTVVYGGTHDNDTAIGWFNAASQRERTFAGKYLNTGGKEINWDLIHAASESVADVAIHSFQDVLGLDSGHRMNLPGKAEGYWEWRFAWEQVSPSYAERLYEITALHGRCAADRLKF
ncbi:MAG: 4-alpha-glucanotransferase [Gallionellaceae bacterium]|nr:MAG: 4-alpha-glucanotransferase [Gallionellaceae bacterium]